MAVSHGHKRGQIKFYQTDRIYLFPFVVVSHGHKRGEINFYQRSRVGGGG